MLIPLPRVLVPAPAACAGCTTKVIRSAASWEERVPCLQIAAMEAADEVDPVAQQIGAVNTLVRQPDGRLKGFNTDWSAAISAIEAGLRKRSRHGNQAGEAAWPTGLEGLLDSVLDAGLTLPRRTRADLILLACQRACLLHTSFWLPQ